MEKTEFDENIPEAADEENESPLEGEVLPLAEEAETLPSEDAGEVDASPDTVDWQARCVAAEETLTRSLAFATLWAPYAKEGEDMKDSPAYARFLALSEKGLSAEEAFAAALCGKLPTVREGRDAPSKAHLTSGVPHAFVSSHRMSGEEMAIARELLGEGYSQQELEKLYRRVAKGQ